MHNKLSVGFGGRRGPRGFVESQQLGLTGSFVLQNTRNQENNGAFQNNLM